MILKGQYTNAVIFSETAESSALDQVRDIINQPFSKDAKVCIMPDVHAGAGICIGYTATLNEYVVPNFIGVDIGCGVTAIPLSKKCDLVFKNLDFFIRSRIPFGFNINQIFDIEEANEAWNGINFKGELLEKDFKKYCERVEGDYRKLSIDKRRILSSIGSLGGGNHFISIDEDSSGQRYAVVHSGSRNYGKCVAEYHQKKASKGSMSDKFGYLSGREKDDYFQDMAVAQIYASLNRRVILKRLCSFLKTKFSENDIIESVHNYIDFSDGIIRKGAIPAKEDEKVLIPISMADGILFCRGKGNLEWNCSAPHGAGRLMSRSNAKSSLTLSEFKKRMDEAGVWSSCIDRSTLDESPMAYKSPDEIKSAIGDTVDIIDHWKEIYNFKASE